MFLWVLQILLAAVFAMAGWIKLLPYDKLRTNPQMARVGGVWPRPSRSVRLAARFLP